MTATTEMFLNTIDDMREFRQRMIDIEGELSLLTEDERQSAKDLLQLCTRISAEFSFIDTLG